MSTSTSTASPASVFTFLSQGALLREFTVAGHNIVLSLPTPAHYKTHNGPYFGETIGRTTNRIKDAQITNLNGQKYTLAANDGPNCLHGGKEGWGKRDWVGPTPVNRSGKEGVRFTYLSKDGEEGYPGTVECRVWYTAGMEEGKTVLEAEYEIEFTGEECEETVVGVTNHSYFNVNPDSPTIDGTIVTLGTNQYLELDNNSIPTGKVIPHRNAPKEANTPFTLGAKAPDFDDCFVFDPPNVIPLDTRTLPLRMQVKLSHSESNLNLEVYSTEPAFQFYTGEGIDVPELDDEDGKKTAKMGPRKGIAIEPSRYVDAPREEWRGMCRLRKGEIFGARSVYKAWKS